MLNPNSSNLARASAPPVSRFLDLIAEKQALSTPQLLSTIYDEALELHGEVPNSASLLRCACTLYLEQPAQVGKLWIARCRVCPWSGHCVGLESQINSER